MQSFCGRIRLVTRHSINTSKIVDSISTRVLALTSSEPYALAAKEVIAALGNPIASPSPLVLQKKIGTQTVSLTSSNNKGMHSVAPFYRKARPGIFHRAAVVPTFPGRYITTTGDSHESISHDTAASASEVVPRIKFKRLDKTARHIMQIVDKEAVEEVRAQREIPDIKPGYIIQLKVEVPENRRRASLYKGIVIARRNAGLNTTIRIRRMVAGVGVESLLPLYSPNIKEIKVLEKKKVRRAKLYYLRDKLNPLKRK